MTTPAPPSGAFTGRISLEAVTPIRPERCDVDGVTQIAASGYELAYRTTLVFADGVELPVVGSIFGITNKSVVIRDAQGRPERIVGYAQGRVEIRDASGGIIFEGHYHDTRIEGALTGDEALTPTGVRRADHWENAIGRGAFAGRVFSACVHFARTGTTSMSGEATGRID